MRNYHKPSEIETDLFSQGAFHDCHKVFGAHPVKRGTEFAVWAPGAKSVRVAGSFNDWDRDADFLEPLASSGVWFGFVPGAAEGDIYKYVIETDTGEILYKADPVAFSAQVRPETASVIAKLTGYRWTDSQWMEERAFSDGFEILDPAPDRAVPGEDDLKPILRERLSVNQQIALRLKPVVRQLVPLDLHVCEEFAFNAHRDSSPLRSGSFAQIPTACISALLRRLKAFMSGSR